METYESAQRDSFSGNLRGTETMITVKLQGFSVLRNLEE